MTSNTGDMITRRTMPWSVYIIFLVAIEAAGMYFSACFLYDDVNISNFGNYILKGCMDNYFLPWRIWNPMTLKCMGIALMGWIFLVSYMMYHFRNWQSGMEHGAEDWGDPFDVTRRRANRDDSKNRILSQNVKIDCQGDRKPSNNNMLVIGSSGSYKTTSIVTPNLLLANDNFIVLDVKGELSYKYGLYLKSRGYTIRVLNLKEQDKSDCYNPFVYIENETDLIKLIANIQDACTPPDSMSADPFWHQGAGLYLQSVFYYEWCVSRKEKRSGTFNNVLKLLNEETIPDPNFKAEKGKIQPTVLQSKMKALEKEEGPDNPAVRDYRKLKEGAAETVRSIVIIINAMLKLCQTDGLKRIFARDELNLRDFATGVGGTIEKPNVDGKIALFIVVNDEDESFNFIASMVYTQALEILSRMADTDFKDRGGSLPIPLTFWMDEFYAGARPHDTEKIMGVIRSRNISMVPILQSVAQIKALFKTEKWEVIMDNCPTLIFLGAGAGAIETHKYISELLGNMTIDTIGDGKHGQQTNSNYGRAGAPLMTPQQVKRMDRKHCIIFTEEERPIYDRKALPWEGNKNFDEAMRLNSESEDGGYVHGVQVYMSENGEAVCVRTEKTAVVEEKDIPAGAKMIVMTDADMSNTDLGITSNPLSGVLSGILALRGAAKKDNSKKILDLTLPSDRDVSGDFYISLSRYYPELSSGERDFILEKIREGWDDERLKGLLKMTYTQMKKLSCG